MSLRQIFAALHNPILRAIVLLLAGGAAPASFTIMPFAIAPAAAQTAGEVVLLTGFRPTPPYVMERAGGERSGLEFEIVMAAARLAGLTLKPELVPLGRLSEDFRRGQFDAIVPANPAMGLPGCLSDTVLVYHNTAFSLAQRGLQIATVQDLANHDVTAFQNAHILLAPEMTAVRQGNQHYREVANQLLQVRALFSGRTDVAILERRIFHFIARGNEVAIDTSAPVAEHVLFAPTSYSMAFHKSEHCAAFNRGLAALKRNGDYDAIVNRWDGPVQAQNGRTGRQPG